MLLNTDLWLTVRLFYTRRMRRTSSQWRTWISALKKLWIIQRITTLPLIKKGGLLNRQCCSETTSTDLYVDRRTSLWTGSEPNHANVKDCCLYFSASFSSLSSVPSTIFSSSWSSHDVCKINVCWTFHIHFKL